MIRHAFTVGGWTLLSRFSGFGRDCLIAAFMGADGSSDSFFVALMLPNFFRRFFAEGAFNAVFIPQFAEIRAHQGEKAAQSYAQNILSGLLVFLVGFVILFELLMPEVISTLAPGLAQKPARFLWATQMARLMFPYIFFVSMANAFSGILNSFGKFSAAAAMQILFNLCMIFFLLFFGTLTPTPGHALAMGVIVSGILHLLFSRHFVLPFMPLHWHIPSRTSDTTIFLKKFIAASLGAGAFQFLSLINTFFGSLLPAGSISYLFYADRLVQFPLGVVGLALTTALLPHLSKAFQENDHKQIASLQEKSLRIGLLLILPATIALICLAFPIIRLLFQRGAFDEADSLMTSQVLQAYAFGLPAYILGKIASTCFFAHKDTKTPALIALVFVGIHLSGAALLSPLLGASGIALSFSIGSWINTLLLGFFLWRQKLFFFNRKGLKPLLEIFLISVLLGFFLVMTEWTLSPLVTSWKGDLFLLLCQISLGGILVLTLSIKVGLIPSELLKSKSPNRLKFFKKSMLFL